MYQFDVLTKHFRAQRQVTFIGVSDHVHVYPEEKQQSEIIQEGSGDTFISEGWKPLLEQHDYEHDEAKL